MHKILTTSLLAIILLAVALFAASATIKRMERAECTKWAKQAQEYRNFYYTNWQRIQCGISK